MVQGRSSLETCALCRKFGVQVAHRNEGRGLSQKSPPHQTAALRPECHYMIDNGRDLCRDDRRRLMDRAINDTHDRLIKAGKLRLA